MGPFWTRKLSRNESNAFIPSFKGMLSSLAGIRLKPLEDLSYIASLICDDVAGLYGESTESAMSLKVFEVCCTGRGQVHVVSTDWEFPV